MSDPARIVMDAFREQSTLNTMLAPPLPKIPRGKQTYKFEVGKTYAASALAPLKEGTPITIISRYKQHGYCYYVANNNQVHREKDLK